MARLRTNGPLFRYIFLCLIREAVRRTARLFALVRLKWDFSSEGRPYAEAQCARPRSVPRSRSVPRPILIPGALERELTEPETPGPVEGVRALFLWRGRP